MAMNLDALLRIKADVLGELNIRRLGNSLQGLQGQANNAALGFNNLKSAVAGFGAAIAGSAIVAGLGAIVKKATDAGGDLDDLQIKTGVSASALFAIGNAAKVAGVDMDTLGKGLGKLNINLVKAAEGNEDLAQKFKRLGVDVKDANGKVVPADKALKQIADRFADMPDGAQKAAAAVALFGKSGADLIPLLNEGAAGLERFKSKLTTKEFEDFTKRSDQFGETFTELGVRTEAFGLGLTAALLPALQSILEVFADLFDTKQDWKALFKVIEVAVRGIAVAVYSVVKVIDILIKNIFAALQAAKQGLAGDFAGAFKTITTRVSSGIAEAKQGIADLNKLAFGSSAAPKAKAAGRPAALDTSAADTAAAAAAKKRASEQERADKRYNEGLQGAIDLAGDLNKQIRDISLSTQDIKADPVDQILNGFQKNLNAIQDEQETLFKKADEFTNKTGVKFEGLRNKIKDLGAARTTQAAAVRDQGLIDLLPSLKEYNDKIAEISTGKTELTAVEKLNAQVNLLQLDILAATKPALAEHVRLLRERAGALDAATAKQKTDSESIGTGIKDRLQEYYNSIKDISGAIGDAVVGSLKGLEDQLTAFVTTGKASFQELAVSILSDLARIALRAAIIQPIVQALGSMFPGFKFANGGIMTGDGPMPLKKYASGGIASSPQLALYGEGRKPEAYVPLPDGRRIPVAMQGGGGGNTTVNVSVDASGNANVQGDQAQGKQLGVAISAAVQAELVKQQRPGGLLAGTRR